MSYSVGQYNFVSGIGAENFLSSLTSGYQATRYPATTNSGVSSLNEEYPFNEECLWYSGAVNEGYEAGNTYYLHCRILQLDTNQTFNIKLMHMSPTKEEEDEVQFLKRIVVQKNSIGNVTYDTENLKPIITAGNNWVDLELVFTPIKNFDSLVFDLVRTVNDGDYDTQRLRYPCIIYNELSLVKNPLDDFNNDEITVVKLGVQSHPGLFMAINNEPIKIGRSGSYELRSDLLEGIDKFAVLEAATDSALDTDQEAVALQNTTQIFAQRHEAIAYRSTQTYHVISVDEYDTLSPYRKMAYEPIYLSDTSSVPDWSEGEDSPSSKCRLDVAKTRTTSSFVLDYMYKQVET